MSQHFYPVTIADGREAMILTGWDRRVEGFFLQIEIPDAHGDQYVYASHGDVDLMATNGFAQNLEYFVDVLNEHGLKLPQSIIDAVSADAELNAGNSVTWYDRSGGIVHQA